MRRVVSILALLMVLFLVTMPIAHADVNHPDTLAIDEARVWRHMLEPDDVLMVARYDATYGNQSAQPSQDISKTFYFTYMNAAGNETLGNETAYPYFNLGYGKGLVAFYWPADDADKPTWGDLGNITVTGTSLFTSPPSATLTLTADDWRAGEQPSTQREDLRQWLLNELIYLEVNWNGIAVAYYSYTDRTIDLTAAVSGGTYATASAQGEAYLGLTIPNITRMCPLLFMEGSLAITHTERDWQLTQQSIFESVHDSDIVGQTGDAISSAMGGIGRTWAFTVVIFAACIGVISLAQVLSGKLNAGLLIAYALVLIATPEGMFQMGLMALFAVIAVLYLADIILPSRAQ